MLDFDCGILYYVAHMPSINMMLAIGRESIHGMYSNYTYVTIKLKLLWYICNEGT